MVWLMRDYVSCALDKLILARQRKTSSVFLGAVPTIFYPYRYVQCGCPCSFSIQNHTNSCQYSRAGTEFGSDSRVQVSVCLSSFLSKQNMELVEASAKVFFLCTKWILDLH